MRTTSDAVKKRMMQDFLGSKLIENNLRGYWCEAMVAEALGPSCQIVSGGWHAWDLQIGRDEDVWPDRVRIQVKNSARLQTWNASSGKVSDCQFDLNYRSRPFYFERDFPEVPCEERGFLCDVFVLCYHPETDWERVDHTDPQQWRFYVVPVNGPSAGVTETEIAWAETQFAKDAKSVKLQRRPGTLEAGIRGRRAIKARRIDQLVADQLFEAD